MIEEFLFQETLLQFGEVNFRLVDVGGQRGNAVRLEMQARNEDVIDRQLIQNRPQTDTNIK